jgi:hypothetical protein
MVIPLDDKKVLELRDYFEGEMTEMCVDPKQTDSDFDEDVVSFFSIKRPHRPSDGNGGSRSQDKPLLTANRQKS